MQICNFLHFFGPILEFITSVFRVKLSMIGNVFSKIFFRNHSGQDGIEKMWNNGMGHGGHHGGGTGVHGGMSVAPFVHSTRCKHRNRALCGIRQYQGRVGGKNGWTKGRRRRNKEKGRKTKPRAKLWRCRFQDRSESFFSFAHALTQFCHVRSLGLNGVAFVVQCCHVACGGPITCGLVSPSFWDLSCGVFPVCVRVTIPVVSGRRCIVS